MAMGSRKVYRTGNVIWVRFRPIRGPRRRRSPKARVSYKMPGAALWVVLLTSLAVVPASAIRGAPGRPPNKVLGIGVKHLRQTQERVELNICGQPGFPAGNSLWSDAAPTA